MVLGYLLYEAADLAYNLGRIGYNSVRGTYYWYYGQECPEVERELRTQEDMEKLTERLTKLEKLLEDKSDAANSKL